MATGVPDPRLAYRTAGLKALAEGGTAARAALDTAKAQIEQTQAASVKDAMLAAAQRGATGDAQAALTSIIGAGANDQTAGLGKRAGAVQTTFDTITPPWSKMFDSERALAEFEKRGGGGGGGGGGGRRGGGGGSGGSGGNDAYWWDWFYENELNKVYGGGQQGKSAFNRDIEGRAPTRGSQMGLAKQYGAPAEYRRGHFGDSPTFRDIVREGAARVAAGQMPRAKYLQGLKDYANGRQGVAKRGKKAIKKAKK